jgi:hypothetical protein
VENRRPITEDDVYLTELLLAKSYVHLKGSVIRASSDALGSFGDAVGGTVRRHPHAAAGAAIGAGLLLFLLAKLTGGGESSRRISADAREERPRSNPALDLLGMLLPFVTPYITAFIGRSFGRTGGRERS